MGNHRFAVRSDRLGMTPEGYRASSVRLSPSCRSASSLRAGGVVVAPLVISRFAMRPPLTTSSRNTDEAKIRGLCEDSDAPAKAARDRSKRPRTPALRAVSVCTCGLSRTPHTINVGLHRAKVSTARRQLHRGRRNRERWAPARLPTRPSIHPPRSRNCGFRAGKGCASRVGSTRWGRSDGDAPTCPDRTGSDGGCRGPAWTDHRRRPLSNRLGGRHSRRIRLRLRDASRSP